jgi:hypothetical protein
MGFLLKQTYRCCPKTVQNPDETQYTASLCGEIPGKSCASFRHIWNLANSERRAFDVRMKGKTLNAKWREYLTISKASLSGEQISVKQSTSALNFPTYQYRYFSRHFPC